MTGHEDFDRTLADWLEADALPPAPVGDLDRVLDVTRRRRPRPAWLARFGSDWVGEPLGAGSNLDVGSLPRTRMHFWPIAFILLLVVAAIVGGAILVGALLVRPSPLPTGRLGHLAYGLDGDIYLADSDGGRSD